MLRGAPQTAVATQGEQQPPLRVRAGVQHALCLLLGDELEPLGVSLDGRWQIRKRVLLDQAFSFRGREELLGASTHPANRILGQPPPYQEQAEPIAITRRNLAQRLVSPEAGDKIPIHPPVVFHRPDLRVVAAVDVALDEGPKSCGLTPLCQPDPCQLVGQVVADRGQPLQRGGVSVSGDLGRVEQLDPQLDALGRALVALAQPDRPPLAVGAHELDRPPAVGLPGYTGHDSPRFDSRFTTTISSPRTAATASKDSTRSPAPAANLHNAASSTPDSRAIQYRLLPLDTIARRIASATFGWLRLLAMTTLLYPVLVFRQVHRASFAPATSRRLIVARSRSMGIALSISMPIATPVPFRLQTPVRKPAAFARVRPVFAVGRHCVTRPCPN